MSATFADYAFGANRLLDLRLLVLIYFSPLGALGLGMAISAWRRGTDYRPPTRLPRSRRSAIAIGVIAMLVAVFEMLSWPLQYESQFHLGPFALPLFCGGLLAWWLAIRIGR